MNRGDISSARNENLPKRADNERRWRRWLLWEPVPKTVHHFWTHRPYRRRRLRYFRATSASASHRTMSGDPMKHGPHRHHLQPHCWHCVHSVYWMPCHSFHSHNRRYSNVTMYSPRRLARSSERCPIFRSTPFCIRLKGQFPVNCWLQSEENQKLFSGHLQLANKRERCAREAVRRERVNTEASHTFHFRWKHLFEFWNAFLSLRLPLKRHDKIQVFLSWFHSIKTKIQMPFLASQQRNGSVHSLVAHTRHTDIPRVCKRKQYQRKQQQVNKETR